MSHSPPAPKTAVKYSEFCELTGYNGSIYPRDTSKHDKSVIFPEQPNTIKYCPYLILCVLVTQLCPNL